MTARTRSGADAGQGARSILDALADPDVALAFRTLIRGAVGDALDARDPFGAVRGAQDEQDREHLTGAAYERRMAEVRAHNAALAEARHAMLERDVRERSTRSAREALEVALHGGEQGVCSARDLLAAALHGGADGRGPGPELGEGSGSRTSAAAQDEAHAVRGARAALEAALAAAG